MPWWGLLLTWLTIAVVIGVVGTRLIKLLPSRTVRNWGGSGVHTELTPTEAGLLLGRHPGVLLSTVLYRLEIAGKARVKSFNPVRFEWVSGDPGDRIETAFAAALGPEGEFSQEGALAVVEAIYDQTNEMVAPYSGRRTALYYQHLIDRFWEEAIERDLWAPEAFGWLLLRDPRKVWGDFGDTPEQRRLKDAYRTQSLLESKRYSVRTLQAMQRERRHDYWGYLDTRISNYEVEPDRAAFHARLAGGFISEISDDDS